MEIRTLFLTAVLFVFGSGGVLRAFGRPDARPNVVVILASDLGYGDVGCFGAKDIRTPNLDRMAREGTRLTSFYVSQSVSSASRASYLTGCYANRVGISGELNHTSPLGIHPNEQLLSDVLAENGYATGIFGKWHLGHHATFWPTNRGFSEFLGIPYSNDNGPSHPMLKGLPALPLYEAETVLELNPDQSRLTERITDWAVGFIARNRERPFFLYVPHVMPHVPIHASAKWRGTSERGLYGDSVQEVDASVGTILRALERNGLDEQTIVVFASDNGPFLSYGEHAGSAGVFRGGKLTVFEGGVRVPCLIRWPGRVPAGRSADGMVASMDLFVSLARMTGSKLPEARLDGLDLSGFLLGASEEARFEFLYYSGDELQAVRWGKWKLHLSHDVFEVSGEVGSGGKPANADGILPEPVEAFGMRGLASQNGYRVRRCEAALYDLEEDPGESRDVAPANPDVVERMRRIVGEARGDLGDGLTVGVGAGVRPAYDVRPVLPLGVRRISNLEYAWPETGAELLDLYLPKSGSGVPLVVWIHGGGWSFGSKEEHCILTWLAAEGVAVASINYRLLHHGCWPSQIEDCRAAVAWLRANAEKYGLDSGRVVVAGGSAGGHLAALLGTMELPEAERIQGVIDFFGPSDLLTMPGNVLGPGKTEADLAKSRGAILLGGIVRDRVALAKEASALHQVSKGDAPFLILHGAKDGLVPLDQSTRLHEALGRAGVASELVVLPEAGHGGKRFDAEEVREKIRVFLDTCFGGWRR